MICDVKYILFTTESVKKNSVQHRSELEANAEKEIFSISEPIPQITCNQVKIHEVHSRSI
jgi:hypothetical protein